MEFVPHDGDALNWHHDIDYSQNETEPCAATIGATQYIALKHAGFLVHRGRVVSDRDCGEQAETDRLWAA
jgi:hypothetical protein